MGRKKKSLTEKSPFKLRRRKLADGRESLVLDRAVDGTHKFEFLKLYLLPGDTQKIQRENARTLRQAEDILRQRTEELINARADEMPQRKSTDITLDKWFDTFMENQKRNGGRCIIGTTNAQKILRRFRPDTLLKDVDKQFCLDFINWMRNEYSNPRNGIRPNARTIAGYGETLRTVLNEAVRLGLIESNPWKQLAIVEKPLRPESKREFLAIDEVKLMAGAFCGNEMVKNAYMFGCFTGLRISDIRALQWKDVTITDNDKYVSVVMNKTEVPIIIPLSKQALKWLPEKTDATKGEDYIFVGMSNAANANTCLKYWAKRAGVNKNVSFHTARHTFATMMLTLGADLYTVSKLLGHRDIKQTQVYAKIIDQRKDDAVNLIDDVMEQHE